MKNHGDGVLRLTFVMFGAACALALYASGALAQNGGGTNHKQVHSALANVPGKAQAMHNPLEGERDAVAAGGKLFGQHCAECHGKKAEGTRRAPNLLRPEVQQARPGALFWVLTNGVVRHGMPVWSKLPEPMRWQIVTFLKSFPPPASGQNGK